MRVAMIFECSLVFGRLLFAIMFFDCQMSDLITLFLFVSRHVARQSQETGFLRLQFVIWLSELSNDSVVISCFSLCIALDFSTRLQDFVISHPLIW